MAQSIAVLLPLSVIRIAVRNFTFKTSISVLASVLVADSGSTSLDKRLLTPVLGRVEAIGKQSLSPGQIVKYLINKKILDF